MSNLIEHIKQSIIEGDEQMAEERVRQALEANIDPLQILDEALSAGADIVGERFENGEYYLPELMMTGRALKTAMELIRPAMLKKATDERGQAKAKIVIATVQTDIHDIGKNVVASMLTGAGFDVVDIGVDVPLHTIISKAEETKADIIALSALLTTSMPYMQDLIDLLEARSLRSRYKVIVGGASVTPEWAASIGSDGTGKDAVEAVRLVRRLTETL
ncbi:MAG TPA: hypothetical protein ENN32_09160 [Chloroflexi bacterium]|nr:hypothetical protein [Chloroflexota bacterium]